MFCPNCGTELSDEVNFCSNCGHPTKKQTGQQPPVEYEFCIIGADAGEHGGTVYTASVGKTVIARSDECRDYTDAWRYGFLASLLPFSDVGLAKREQENRKAREQLHLDLVAELANQGWEPFTYNPGGSVQTMRRTKGR